MTEPDLDILDRRGRLLRIGLAMLIGGAATFFVLRAMINSGQGPQKDPVGQASVVIMGVVMFALTTMTSLKFMTRIRDARRRTQAR